MRIQRLSRQIKKYGICKGKCKLYEYSQYYSITYQCQHSERMRSWCMEVGRYRCIIAWVHAGHIHVKNMHMFTLPDSPPSPSSSCTVFPSGPKRCQSCQYMHPFWGPKLLVFQCNLYHRSFWGPYPPLSGDPHTRGPWWTQVPCSRRVHYHLQYKEGVIRLHSRYMSRSCSGAHALQSLERVRS